MNIALTVNEKLQAMLLHEKPLNFTPEWVEFSHDDRTIRIIGPDGQEFKAGVTTTPEILKYLHDVNDIVLIWINNGVAEDGYRITFVNQYYDKKRPEGARNAGSWSDTEE